MPISSWSKVIKSVVARGVPFDNTTSGLVSENVQAAIDEIASSSIENNFAYFSIWAEENAGIANGQQEYSFGNGATGAIGITLPIDAQLVAVSYQADTAGTNTEVAVTQNNTNVATTGPQSTESGFTTLGSPIQFSAGDIVGFRTVTGGGAVDVRPAAWFRVPITTLLDVGLDDLNDVTLTSPSNGQILVYNGSEWVNQNNSGGVTNHSGLVLDDGTNPHGTTQSDVGLGNVDNTSDLNKPISTATQAALDLKYDASNPAGYVDAAGAAAAAPVQSVNAQTGVVVLDADDIDDSLTTNKFATQAELDQIATNTSNISTNTGNILTNTNNISELTLNQDDLITLSGVPENSTNLGIFTGATIPDNSNNKQALQALETGLEDHIADAVDAHDASAISYDNSTSGLTATEVQAALDEIDSDLDTHIADTTNPHVTTFTQVVAADPGTDITTAEAEELTDGSTTQLHFHRELVDETGTDRVDVLNGGDVQLSNYPQTRNDTTSNDEKVLTTDNSGNLVLRRVLPFYDSIKKVSNDTDQVGINQTTILEDWLTLSVTIPETGNYDIDWFYTWSFNDGAQDFVSQILLDGSPISTYSEHRQEPKDAAGTGVDLLNTTGGVTNSGTNQRHKTSGFEPEVNLTAGAHTVTIQWAGSQNNDEATIYEGAIRIKRVS